MGVVVSVQDGLGQSDLQFASLRKLRHPICQPRLCKAQGVASIYYLDQNRDGPATPRSLISDETCPFGLLSILNAFFRSVPLYGVLFDTVEGLERLPSHDGTGAPWLFCGALALLHHSKANTCSCVLAIGVIGAGSNGRQDSQPLLLRE